MNWNKENETAKCAGDCGKDVTIVVGVRENGSRAFDIASTQAAGTHSTLNADCTWSHYCRECFLADVLAFFKGKVVGEEEQ
jgi:hypothetical protein